MSRETKCILVRSRDRCHKVIGSVFEGKSVALFLYINTQLVDRKSVVRERVCLAV